MQTIKLHLPSLNDDVKKQSGKNIQPVKSLKRKSTNLCYERFQVIDQFIKSQEIYLEPTFSLNSLANLLSLSEGYMSQLINHFSGQNFATYVNRLRVEAAKEKLLNDQYRNYTIVGIALESGFNSKSAFYNAFKKIAGMPPVSYRQQLQNAG